MIFLKDLWNVKNIFNKELIDTYNSGQVNNVVKIHLQIYSDIQNCLFLFLVYNTNGALKLFSPS